MALTVNSNISSLNAQRNLNTSQSSLTTSLQRLSSGLRINSAKDDAAGFAIAERFTAQIRGNDQAARNANDGISLAQTASGDLEQISANLQRVRELAVQASNASNSASDRVSLNNEANQLVSEIDRVASNSSFNGTKLLDGSFSAKSFQVGANNSANDRIQIAAIASARTTSLGVGSGSSYATVKSGSAVTANALAAGDLTINGYQVGATVSDGVSNVDAAGSGIAKAAAINAVQDKTGVSATVSATTVTGTAVTAFTAIAAGDITINGVDIGAVSAATTAAERGGQVAAAINAKSNQTGVTATFNTTTGAVALNAADGRNISVSRLAVANTGVAANVSGLGSATTGATLAAATNTSTSTLSLSSNSANGITVANGNGSSGGSTNIVGAAPTVWGVAGNINSGDLLINGVDVIGVSMGPLMPGGISAFNQGTMVAGVINSVAAQAALGGAVTAAVDVATGAVTLTSASPITLAISGTATLANTGFTSTVPGGGALDSGLTTGYKAATATAGAGVASLDLTSVAGATAALDTIDAAINTIAKTQGALGAYQNRFESTIASLQTTSENLTASRSRIKDADFAKETAALSRAQVLQQAGTAILAQANQSSQGVLSLLR